MRLGVDSKGAEGEGKIYRQTTCFPGRSGLPAGVRAARKREIRRGRCVESTGAVGRGERKLQLVFCLLPSLFIQLTVF